MTVLPDWSRYNLSPSATAYTSVGSRYFEPIIFFYNVISPRNGGFFGRLCEHSTLIKIRWELLRNILQSAEVIKGAAK